MTKFYPATVTNIYKTTSDCSIIELDLPKDAYPYFRYDAGQYLTLKADIDGAEVRRSYSLCSSPLDGIWQIGVKKIAGGRFSTYANDVLQVGDTVEVMPPQGSFTTEMRPEAERKFVGFAAGSGITPILSIIKTVLLSEPRSKFQLYYVNRTASSIILKEELEALKNQFMERFEIFYFLTKQQRDIPFLNGRINEEKLQYIFSNVTDALSVDHYFTCGPEAMTMLISDFLKKKGVSKDKIHFELFGTDAFKTKEKESQLKATLAGKRCDLTIIEGGKSMSFSIEQGAQNVLDAALAHEADLPFACKGGVCATCKAKVIEGKTDMLLSYGLESDEIAAGYVLTCQAIPTSERVVVDFDV